LHFSVVRSVSLISYEGIWLARDELIRLRRRAPLWQCAVTHVFHLLMLPSAIVASNCKLRFHAPPPPPPLSASEGSGGFTGEQLAFIMACMASTCQKRSCRQCKVEVEIALLALAL